METQETDTESTESQVMTLTSDMQGPGACVATAASGLERKIVRLK